MTGKLPKNNAHKPKITSSMILIICSVLLLAGCSTTKKLGIFEGQTDVGQIKIKGSTQFDPNENTYTITASGENIWYDIDAFHFAWKKTKGDLELITDIDWSGVEKHNHRKAGWMVRESLSADSPYVDAVVHGDGLICLQYRKVQGGGTMEIRSALKAPATMRLQRDGDLFTLSVASKGQNFQPVGSVSVPLADPVYTGLVVCSHDADITETAVFSNVTMENALAIKKEKRMLQSTLEVVSIETGQRTIAYRANEHFEAPNWSCDGNFLIFNSKGRIYKIAVKGGEPTLIDTGTAQKCNNDHGLSPDGESLVISDSSEGTSLIYILPSAGGTPRKVTTLGPSYWHGWSPDGKTLTYCAERNGEYDVYTISVDGGNETRLTSSPGLDDGPDYSPDGKYIYLNSERTGLMKIWRMKANGSEQQQVTFDDEYADWFPHPSPDGKWLVFLSYDKSVRGHPPNKDVQLRIMPVSDGQPKILTKLFGGQGTINVPSWSPDSKYVAFVSYRLVSP
jgi:Tol biopolymer transport system component